MSDVELHPDEVVEGRSFTDLRHSALDLQVMRYLITCVALTLEHAQWVIDECPVILYQPAPDQWMLRRVLTAPNRLSMPGPLTVVGFFGQRSPSANLAFAQELDRELLKDLTTHDGLLAYISLQLPTANFANLVLFDSPEAKERFGASPRHAEALRQLLPDFYSSVRLYNGTLPAGVGAPDGLRLHVVKYYDYRSRPMWRARRPLQMGEDAWASA